MKQNLVIYYRCWYKATGVSNNVSNAHETNYFSLTHVLSKATMVMRTSLNARPGVRHTRKLIEKKRKNNVKKLIIFPLFRNVDKLARTAAHATTVWWPWTSPLICQLWFINLFRIDTVRSLMRLFIFMWEEISARKSPQLTVLWKMSLWQTSKRRWSEDQSTSSYILVCFILPSPQFTWHFQSHSAQS